MDTTEKEMDDMFHRIDEIEAKLQIAPYDVRTACEWTVRHFDDIKALLCDTLELEELHSMLDRFMQEKAYVQAGFVAVKIVLMNQAAKQSQAQEHISPS